MKTTSIVSVFKLRCPRCGKGKLFLDPNPYHLKRLTDMPDNCPECGLDFRVETGFYWGALYFSYFLNVALFLVMFLGYTAIAWGHLLDYSDYFLMTMLPAIIILSPYILRLSRAIWLYIDLRFFQK